MHYVPHKPVNVYEACYTALTGSGLGVMRSVHVVMTKQCSGDDKAMQW